MTVTDEATRAAGFDFARAGRSAEFRARLRRLGYDGERDSVLPVMASELFSDALLRAEQCGAGRYLVAMADDRFPDGWRLAWIVIPEHEA